jgi:cephalosporin-C deacetylase-like acetyl esterase
MKKLFLFIVFAVASSVYATKFNITIVNDHTNLLYKCGEEALFNIVAKYDSGALVTNGVVDLTLDNFGDTTFISKKWDIAKSNPLVVKGSLKKPGFLRLTLSSKEKKIKNLIGRNVKYIWSVGFDVEKILQKRPCPKDFDEFWANAQAKLDAEVPADVKLELNKEKTDADKKVNWYKISFATAAKRRVYGWLLVPKDASATKRYPVRVTVSAAGFGPWTNRPARYENAISMFFSVYNWPVEFDFEKIRYRYQEQEEMAKKITHGGNYPLLGIMGVREDSFFYPVILGVNRAVNWLAAQEYVDKSSFFYKGTSQGGGMGFALVGLNKNFTHGAVHVPALTGHAAWMDGHMDGWPRFRTSLMAHCPDKVATIERNADYYDGVNFAMRIKVPFRVTVGFADITCPPHAVYSAFNVIPSKDKEIFHGHGMSHSVDGKFERKINQWAETIVR